MQDPLRLDIPYSPAPKHRHCSRGSLHSPLRKSSGNLDALMAPRSSYADLLEASQLLSTAQSSGKLQQSEHHSACQGEIYLEASCMGGSKDRDAQHEVSNSVTVSTVSELQMQEAPQETLQTDSSSHSLARLTSMCQRWRSFDDLTPLGCPLAETHARAEKLRLAGREIDSASMQSTGAGARTWEQASEASTFEGPGAPFSGEHDKFWPCSIDAALQTQEESVTSDEHWRKPPRNFAGGCGGSMTSSCTLQAEPRFQRTICAFSMDKDERSSGNEENVSLNVCSGAGRQRRSRVSCNGSTQGSKDHSCWEDDKTCKSTTI